MYTILCKLVKKQELKELKTPTCPLEPNPIHLLKEFLGVLQTHLTSTMNASQSSGYVTDPFKVAVTRPLLKNPSINSLELSNYRYISNVPFLSRVLEDRVTAQFWSYLACGRIQSGFCQGHSTEIASTGVIDDITKATDADNAAVLLLSDFSVA